MLRWRTWEVPMPRIPAAIQKLEASLRAHALGFPGAHEEFPWGERVVKVGKKIFVFFGAGAEEMSFSVKLPRSHFVALALPFTRPTGYGLGESGWVSVRLRPGEHPPVQVFEPWIEESYRAIAPKKLIAELDARRAATLRRPAQGGLARPRRLSRPARERRRQGSLRSSGLPEPRGSRR
jgi:predicted DNA-binding protein (MmcQ/YjbR family)